MKILIPHFRQANAFKPFYKKLPTHNLRKIIIDLETEKTPEHLYKVLSFKHWQETLTKELVTLSFEDDAFIHFSKEEQLDRVIAKYWSEPSQFVVLKIKTGNLKGDLVYETNPGGVAKYYHLYKGFIPFSSIVESKVICR